MKLKKLMKDGLGVAPYSVRYWVVLGNDSTAYLGPYRTKRKAASKALHIGIGTYVSKQCCWKDGNVIGGALWQVT